MHVTASTVDMLLPETKFFAHLLKRRHMSNLLQVMIGVTNVARTAFEVLSTRSVVHKEKREQCLSSRIRDVRQDLSTAQPS